MGRHWVGGLYEFRLRWTAAEVRAKAARVSDAAEAKTDKIMLRVFFCTAGRKIILLLSGYDKGRDTSGRRQDRAISGARKLMTAHQEAQKRASKRRGCSLTVDRVRHLMSARHE